MDDTTLEGIVEAERNMVLAAEEKYGEYFTHAVEMVTLLNNLASSIDRPERFLFVAFLSHIRKHFTLSLFSAARRHHVQTGMNLRQVLESSAWAAYALVHEDINLFQVQDEHGHVDVPQRLSDARNSWLNTHYSVKSEEIRRLKKQINKSVAHANIAYVFQTFGLSQQQERPGFTTSYFDAEDDFRIKTDLLMIANFAMGMIDLFVNINQTERVFRLPADFVDHFRRLTEQHAQLRTEIGSHEMFQGL